MATYTTNIGLAKPAPTDPADIAVLNSNFDKIDEKCNPALFAPSGYGLGEAASRPATDYNTCVMSGYYRGDNAANTPEQTWSIHSYAALVVERGNAQINQRLIGRGCVATRHSLDSGVTWQPWEYENPPMSLGVEYRTTERWNGAVVYAKMVEFGYLPNAGAKEYTFSNSNTTAAISLFGRAISGSTLITIPYAGDEIVVSGYQNKLIIRTKSDYSSWYGYVGVKYTK